MNQWTKYRQPVLMLAAVLFIVTSPVAALAQQEEERVTLDEIVAKVNSEIITLTDLNKSLRQLRLALEQEAQDSGALEEAYLQRKKFVLRNLIQNKIMLQRAEELGITADIDLDVSAYLEEMRKESGIPSLDVLDQYFRQRGSSLAEYRQSIREQFITRSLLSQYVYSKITLLTPEVEAYYNEHKAEYTIPAQVELAEILFLTEGKDKEEVKARAEKALARLEAGENFEDVATEISEGPTASRGGKIGTFSQGSMNDALEAVVFKMQAGDHSGIIEASYGFQIVKLLNLNPSSMKPINEVRPQIADAIYQTKAEPEVKEFLEMLVDESYVFVTPQYVEEYDLSNLYEPNK